MGRQSGLLINPFAVDHLLGQDRPRAWLAGAARISDATLSQLMSGGRGASPAMVDKIAGALGCHPAVLFPELVPFTVAVRYFTTSGAES